MIEITHRRFDGGKPNWEASVMRAGVLITAFSHEHEGPDKAVELLLDSLSQLGIYEGDEDQREKLPTIYVYEMADEEEEE